MWTPRCETCVAGQELRHRLVVRAKTVWVWAVTLAILAAIDLALSMYSGVYGLSADSPNRPTGESPANRGSADERT